MTKFFFSDIAHWDPTKCLQRRKKIMPKIIVSFLNANFSSKIAILHIITEKLLPYLTSLEREKFFVPVLLEVCNLYEFFCEKVITAIVENVAEINKIKTHVVKEMNSAIVVICKLSECLLTDACKNTDRPSFLILDYGFHILTYTYKFLEDAYHCSGNDFADSLVRMHASSKILMKAVIEILTKYLLSGNYVIPLHLLMICANIQRLYAVVAAQKPEIHVLLWRVYAKVIIHHNILREDSFSFHSDQISYLCLYTWKLFKDLRICGEKDAGKDCMMKNFDRQVQICGYHLKVITYLIGEQAKFEDECYENLRILVEELASFSLFYFSKNFCGRSCSNWFHCNIVSSIECLLHCLLRTESFLSFLILPLKEETKQEEKVSLCFCKLFCMQLVIANTGDIQKCSCSTVLAVVGNVIEDLCLCDAKFLYTFITVIKSKDGTFRIINLYEYMLIALCTFPSVCCPEHFKDMEKLMLKTLLGKNDEFSCLACDVWFFFFGCGAINLIYCYFDMFKKTAKHHNERTFMWMNYLKNRIAKFISHEVKASFLRKYHHSFQTLIQTKCVHFRNTESHRVYLLQDIMVEQSPVLFSYQRRLKKLDALLFRYDDDTDLVKVMYIDISTCLLLLSRHLVNNADPKSLLQLIYFAGVMWSTQCDVIQIAVLLFLQALKGKYVSPDPEENRIFRCLGKLFSNVLGHKNYVMRHEAYNVFYEFLQSTPQRRFIEECFEISPHLLIPVQKFIKKVPSIKLISNQEIIESLVCELSRGETDVKLHRDDKFHLLHILNASKSEILDKKQRQEMHLLLKRIRNAFEQLASFEKLPSWVSKSLKDSWQLMNKFSY